MDTKRLLKHKEVVVWWLSNPKLGVWHKITQECGWDLTFCPIFSLNENYVQNDKYAKFRKAQKDGKIIEILYEASGCWNNCHPNNLWKPQWQYRIKPDEPKFKVDDWIIDNANYGNDGYIFQMKTDTILSTPDFNTRFKLWEPQKNEWCVFWNNDKEEYIIKKFKKGIDKYFHITTLGNEPYECIAPLKFIQILKGK